MKSLLNLLRQTFSMDLRALGLLRIAIGAVLLLDLSIRVSDLEVFYTNDGVLPLHLLFQYNWEPGFFSFHTMSGSFYFQLALFLLAFVFALAYMLGYKTRWTGFLSWILLLSLHNRNSLITQGGDDLLRMSLFWMLFMPVSTYYSIDSMLKGGEKPSENRFFSPASMAFILQVGFVYFFSALLKSSPEWSETGTAIYYALSLDQLILPLGKVIYSYPEFLKKLTFGVYYLELLAPFLLLIPVKNNLARLLFIVMITGLHIGIGLTLFVGLFPIISVSVLLGLLPGRQAQFLGRPVARLEQRVTPWIKSQHQRFRQVLNVVEVRVNTQRLGQSVRNIKHGFLIFCLTYCLFWNTKHIYPEQLSLLDNWANVGNFLRINQNWGMFSPGVFKDDGWFVAQGALSNGDTINVFSGQEIEFEKPENVVAFYKNDRWRKYFEHYIFIAKMYMRPVHCQYLLRKWNDRHPEEEQLQEVQVYFMKEVSAPDYEVYPVTKEMVCQCTL